MIFVTVGTHDQNFNRLIRAADDLAELVDEKVVIQRGCSNIIPRHATYFDFGSSQEIEEWIERSRIVIAHAGAGTIIMALRYSKQLVLVPRLALYKEVINDHQLQLATAMEQKRYAIIVSDLTAKSLLDAVVRASELKEPQINSSTLVQAIHGKLNAWQELLGKHKEEK